MQPYLPYGGDTVAQGSTLMHHEHLGISYNDNVFLGAHFMHAFTADKVKGGPNGTQKNGHIWNLAFDLKLEDLFFGDGYIGFSHMDLKDPGRVGGALEAIHSMEGWSYLENYFKVPGSDNVYSPTGGTINSLLFQYELSMAKLLWHPKEFWGQGPDLLIKIFGMLNFINPDSAKPTAAADTKFKWGADVVYVPLKWFGIGGRVDGVNPNMDDNTQSFYELSGRFIFKTSFVANEELTLQYTHYLLGDNTTTGYPWNDGDSSKQLAPDTDVITIAATMYW
jgi:hypothetical protein